MFIIYPFILYKSNNCEKILKNYEKTIYNCKILWYNCNRIIIGGVNMTSKEIYCMGQAEYLATYEGYSLLEGYKKVEEE